MHTLNTNGLSMNESKVSRYRELVDHRKKCHACSGLTNLSLLDCGTFDSRQIGG